jgi:hypothetical protein
MSTGRRRRAVRWMRPSSGGDPTVRYAFNLKAYAAALILWPTHSVTWCREIIPYSGSGGRFRRYTPDLVLRDGQGAPDGCAEILEVKYLNDLGSGFGEEHWSLHGSYE